MPAANNGASADAKATGKNLKYLEINIQVTQILFSILSLRDFFSRSQYFIGMGFFALSRNPALRSE